MRNKRGISRRIGYKSFALIKITILIKWCDFSVSKTIERISPLIDVSINTTETIFLLFYECNASYPMENCWFENIKTNIAKRVKDRPSMKSRITFTSVKRT